MRTNPFRALPDHVEVNGKRVPIDPSFRVGVAIELEVLKEEKPDVAGLLSLFYRGSVPADVKAAVSAVAESLGSNGRILVRESGTEPVVRVMVEAGSTEECERYVDQVIDVIKSRGYAI